MKLKRDLPAIAAVATLLSTTPILAQTSMAQPVVLENETILRVKGEGLVEVPPEAMTIEIGVITVGDTANDALIQNSQQTSAIIAEIRALGIASEDVETADLEVEPRYSEMRDSDQIIGWRARNSLMVSTRDLDRAGEIVAALFAAGGNDIRTPEFGLTPETKLLATRRAEALALAEARQQAQAAADALDMRVARILLVSDSDVRFSSGGNRVVLTGSRIIRPVVPIEPGEVQVEATYSVEFTLVPE